MKSKAHIKGHPLHQILIAFPVAFLTDTLLFDVLALFTENRNYWLTGCYLEIAGIIGGLVAAVPGLIDYLFTVPPRSSARARATRHALLNVGMLAVFFLALLLRDGDYSLLIIGIEIAGVILLIAAGWLGGTLVVRNQIGVNPRYAGAGKWKEAYFTQSSGLLEVAVSGELKADQMKLLHIRQKRIVLGRTEKGYVAFDDHCTHKGGSLAGGAMICGTVQCPWHGSQFDVETGHVYAGPAIDDICVYPVTEENGKVYLRIPDREEAGK